MAIGAYAWNPAGTVLDGTGATKRGVGQGKLALTDSHGNQAGQFTASAASLSGSRAYDPWGNLTATSGVMTGLLGYQSAWSDAAAGKDLMGARWYNPGAGDFTSRDTVTVAPDPDPAAGNPFAYAADSPLDYTDPTGHGLLPDPGSTAGFAEDLKAIAALQAKAAITKAATQKAAAKVTTQQQASAAQKAAAKAAAAKKTPAAASGCTFLSLAGCAGQLRSASVTDASPAQRAADSNAAKVAAAEAANYAKSTGTKSSSTKSSSAKSTPCALTILNCEPCQSGLTTDCYHNNYLLNTDNSTSGTNQPRDPGNVPCLSLEGVTVCPVTPAASGEEASPNDGSNDSSAGSDDSADPGLPGGLAKRLLQQAENGTTPEAQDIIQSTARAQAAQGVDALKGALSPAELAAMEADPGLASRMLGQAAHRLTADALDEAYPGRFLYYTRGPDFVDTETGERLELTTPGQVGSHRARPGYDAITMCLYTLPAC